MHLDWALVIDSFNAVINTKRKTILHLFRSTIFSHFQGIYEGRTESHEQLFFACELGTADEDECGGRWNQLLYYP